MILENYTPCDFWQKPKGCLDFVACVSINIEFELLCFFLPLFDFFIEQLASLMI
jgi:hypothetical protein